MFDPKSDYALNKLDKEAIVCPSATGVHIRLTREDFASEEEFLYWKELSDGDYKDTESAGRGYYDNCVPLTGDLKSPAPSVEEVLLTPLRQIEQAQKRAMLLQKVKAVLTEKQYRRLWMLCVERKSALDIAKSEGVSRRAVYACLKKAQEAIVNKL